MKKFFKFSITAILVAAIAWACNDSFSEEDFIQSQLNLKAKQDSLSISRLNDSGQLMAYTVQVLEDKVPVADVKVTMGNPPDNTTAPTTATTDANGFGTFPSVRMGSNTFLVSKTGYYSATFIVNFGNPTNGINYTIVNNTVVPIKLNASNQVPFFASGGTGETGVIKGNVTIETDLTNMTPEVPQNLTLKANFVGAGSTVGGGSNQTSNGQNATLVQYYFNSNSVGTAVVDNTTGAYSMTVPASADGRIYTLIYPVITTTQKIGYAKQNALPIAPTVSSTVATSFGPGLTYDLIPVISGAGATFTPAAPAAAGQGAKLTFTAYPRSINVGTIFSYNSSSIITANNVTYQLTNRGSGYTTAPSVTVTGGGATTQATMSAALTGIITGIGVTNAGTGYTGNVNFKLQMSNDNGITFYDAYDIAFNQINFTRDVGSTPTGIASVTLPTTGPGIDPTLPFSAVFTGAAWINAAIAYGITNFKWVITGNGTGATANPVMSCGIERLQFLTGGTGYTSAPTITIGAPGAGSQATISVVEFNTQWSIAIDNSANSTPYSVAPTTANMVFSVNNSTFQNNNIVDQLGATTTLINNLSAAGGNVVFADPTRTYRTQAFSQSAPVSQIVSTSPVIAIANVNIVSTLGSSTFGQVTSLTSLNNGTGYNAPLSVTIAALTGLSGSGAKADLTGGVTYNSTSKVYSWNGTSVITNPGSGYQPFANMYYAYPAYGIGTPTLGNNSSSVDFNATLGNNVNQTVRAGDVIINDVRYGTGDRSIDVNN